VTTLTGVGDEAVYMILRRNMGDAMDERSEPRLHELLEGRITRLLMESDHVDPREVEALMVRVRERRAALREGRATSCAG
jgi:hypothetical protein